MGGGRDIQEEVEPFGRGGDLQEKVETFMEMMEIIRRR